MLELAADLGFLRHPSDWSRRVHRGGSYDNAALRARSANRNSDLPLTADDVTGLRPARLLDP